MSQPTDILELAITITLPLKQWKVVDALLRLGRYADVYDIMVALNGQAAPQIAAFEEEAARQAQQAALDPFLMLALDATIKKLEKDLPIELPPDGRLH